MFYIVSYDIPDNRRRNKLAKIMESFGDRIQKSVFECNMGEQEKERMVKRIFRCVDIEEDSVRLYRLCRSCKDQIEIIGHGEVSEDPDIIIV